MSTTLIPRRARQSMLSLSPFRALRDEFDQMFNRLSSDWNGSSLISEFSPACDLSETPDAFQVRLDVPGIKPDDIHIEVTDNSVRISGQRKEEKEEKGKTYHRVERRSGEFSESMVLPCSVKEDRVEADYHDGVLTVTLPKAEAAKTRTVKIKSNGK